MMTMNTEHPVSHEKRGVSGWSDLDLQFCHQFVVGLCVFALQVLHEATTFTDLLDQTAA